MRRVAAAVAATVAGATAVVLARSAAATSPRSALTGEPPGARPASADGGAAGSAAGAAGPTRAGTFTGEPVDTPYGTMRVAAVISAGRLTDVRVLQQTDGARSGQIDADALPILRSEALSAQSADIDTVSGATYTSEGYARSLQSALDQAGR